jgi:hypothetical protein
VYNSNTVTDFFAKLVVEVVVGVTSHPIVLFIKKRLFGTTKAKQISMGGGKGGNATVRGQNSVAVGGAGGRGGPYGKGGDGGDAHVEGDNVFAMGGEGGEAGQLDRGGRGGRSPFEILGAPNLYLPDGSRLWNYGRGGDGAGPTSKSDE